MQHEAKTSPVNRLPFTGGLLIFTAIFSARRLKNDGGEMLDFELAPNLSVTGMLFSYTEKYMHALHEEKIVVWSPACVLTKNLLAICK